MKAFNHFRLITILILSNLLVVSASADFLRVEAGAGAWINGLGGDVDSDLSPKFSTDSLGTSTETTGYIWLNFKHPLPLIPNIRLEYVKVDLSGSGSVPFAFEGLNYTANTTSSIQLTQFDAIAYYNLLDNTFWATIDVGIDVKAIDFDFTASSGASKTTKSESIFLPMLYSRLRAELPTTNIGLEANAKYIGYKGDKLLDYAIKVDYTFAELLPVDLLLEVGYRKQQMTVDGSGYNVDINIDGVFAGIAIKF